MSRKTKRTKVEDRMTVPPQLLSESLMNPYAENDTSQRAMMYAGNLGQFVLVDGLERARVGSGFETMYGDYRLNSTRVPEPLYVHAIHLQHYTGVSAHIASGVEAPVTIIATGTRTRKIYTFEISKYQHFGGEWGAVYSRNADIRVGNVIPPDTEMMSSPTQQGSAYCYGMNVPTAYMDIPETTNDSIVISDEVAEAASSTGIKKEIFCIEEDTIPSNSYGDNEEYRILPEVGEQVNEDGVLYAARRYNKLHFLDLHDRALATNYPGHTKLILAKPGAIVTDIKVYLSGQITKNTVLSGPLQQLVNIRDAQHSHYCRTVNTIYSLIDNGYELTDDSSCLVRHYMEQITFDSVNRNVYPSDLSRDVREKLRLKEQARKAVNLIGSEGVVRIAEVHVTYSFRRKVTIGCKASGRHGDKGIIGAINPKSDMPLDEYGRRAGAIKSSKGGFNRSNLGQMYEQHLGGVMYVLHQRIIKGEVPANEIYDYVLRFFDIVEPLYASKVRECTSTADSRAEFIKTVKKHGLYIERFPYNKNRPKDVAMELERVFRVGKTRVWFAIINENNEREVIQSEEPVLIGDQYTMILDKFPYKQVQGVSFHTLNQFMMPMRGTHNQKKGEWLGITPIALGEDEKCLSAMSVGARATERLTKVQGTAPTAVKKLIVGLFTSDKPSQFGQVDMTDDEVLEDDSAIRIMKHTLGGAGAVLRPSVRNS